MSDSFRWGGAWDLTDGDFPWVLAAIGDGTFLYSGTPTPGAIMVGTSAGFVRAEVGDFIVRDDTGRLSVSRPN